MACECSMDDCSPVWYNDRGMCINCNKTLSKAQEHELRLDKISFIAAMNESVDLTDKTVLSHLGSVYEECRQKNDFSENTILSMISKK